MNTLPGIEEDPLDGWCGDATSVVEFLRRCANSWTLQACLRSA